MTSARPWEAPPTGAPAAAAAAFAALVPELATARLRLRAPRLSDFPAYADIIASERGRTLTDTPDRETAWLDFCQMVAGWPLRGYGPWTIETSGNRTLAGFVVLVFEFGDPEPELGWILSDAAEGYGYATEAAEAVRAYAYRALGFKTLVSYIDADNLRSIAVARRLNARPDPSTALPFENVRVYRHPAPEVLQ